MNDSAAKAIFLAGLPRGPKGDLIPGHTTWEDLGPKARQRYRLMAEARENSDQCATTLLTT